jgi:hypothetical protein
MFWSRRCESPAPNFLEGMPTPSKQPIRRPAGHHFRAAGGDAFRFLAAALHHPRHDAIGIAATKWPTSLLCLSLQVAGRLSPHSQLSAEHACVRWSYRASRGRARDGAWSHQPWTAKPEQFRWRNICRLRLLPSQTGVPLPSPCAHAWALRCHLQLLSPDVSSSGEEAMACFLEYFRSLDAPCPHLIIHFDEWISLKVGAAHCSHWAQEKDGVLLRWSCPAHPSAYCRPALLRRIHLFHKSHLSKSAASDHGPCRPGKLTHQS